MWVKICGITTLEAARACVEAGADAIGFVFADSKRRISVEDAGKIIKALPQETQKVGVFVDMPWKEAAEIENCIGLDLLQFHGSESPHYCSLFPGKAIKSFRVSSARDLRAIRVYRGKVRACLLDSFQSGKAGGTGKAWNWKLFNAELYNRLAGIPLIVAGGLTPGNVTAVLQELKPDGVDISSGVERDGEKDPALIKRFVEIVRRWENGILA